jgi:hypothetical protein
MGYRRLVSLKLTCELLLLTFLTGCVTFAEFTKTVVVQDQESISVSNGTAQSSQDTKENLSVTPTTSSLSYREDISMIEKYVLNLAKLLERNGLISGIEPSEIEKAEELPLVGNTLLILIPEYVLFQDSEIIYQNEDLVKLVEEVANITNNDWDPNDINALLDWENNRAVIEFHTSDGSFVWEFDQYGDCISDGFFNSLFQYANQNLDGSFFKYSSMGQEFFLVYLPEPVANEYKQFQDTFAPSSDELAEFVTSAPKWQEKGYSGWYLVREVLREINLENINEPTGDGKYIVNILRELGKAGNSWAIELEGEIIALGADRYPGQ